MKRFDDDNNEEFKDEDFPDIDYDGDDEELNAEYLAILEKRELIEAIKLQLVQKEINIAILMQTIAYLQKSWFWSFKSLKKKLRLIVETYQTFKALADIDLAQYQDEGEQQEEK